MIIDLSELEEGENELLFDEPPEELHINDQDLYFEGPIQTRMIFYKLGKSLSARGEAKFRLRLDCARCLEPVSFPMAVPFHFVFQKNRPHQMDDDDDETLIFIESEFGKIELA